jgi:hypothetical protein
MSYTLKFEQRPAHSYLTTKSLLSAVVYTVRMLPTPSEKRIKPSLGVTSNNNSQFYFLY